MSHPVYSIIAVRTAQASLLGAIAHWIFHWPLTGFHALGLFLTPALCLYFVFVFVGTLTWRLPILSHLPGAESSIALTFDDGPSPEVTPLILDILRSEGVSATFFVLGEAVEKNPDLLRRIIAEGHAVGIHAFTHEPFVLQSARQTRRQIKQTETAITQACPDAIVIPWVRPPHGFKSLSLAWTLQRSGYGLAAWSVDSRDYREHDAAEITAGVLRSITDGAVILLHDGPKNKATVAALPSLLHGLRSLDLRPVTLPGPDSTL